MTGSPDSLPTDTGWPFAAVPRVDEDRVAALERGCRELRFRLDEKQRLIDATVRELNTEILRRIEAQAALLQTQKLETLGSLARGIAHDFNNVLHGILASYDVLEMRAEDARHRRVIELGRRSVDHGIALSRRLLSLCRPQSSDPQPLSPAQVLSGVADLLQLVAKGEITCTVKADPDLWPVMADRIELETVLLNLAVNARDAMPDGGTLEVLAQGVPRAARRRPKTLDGEWPDGEWVLFSVRDTGIGMAPEVLARATEIFFTTKAPGRGTGLGLAMASSFAARCGGLLRIESTVGRGTRVDLLLPRAAGADAPVDAPVGGTARDNHRGGTILVADEVELNRTLAARLLRDLGYHVIEAGSPTAALALSHAAAALDCAILSASLPDGGAERLVGLLRIERPQLPALVLADPDHAAAPMPKLAVVLPRPYSAATLAASVHGVLADRWAFEDRAVTLSQRLRDRLPDPALKETLAAWCRLRGGTPLPRIADAVSLLAETAPHHFLAAVDVQTEPPRFRLVSIGSALTARLGQGDPEMSTFSGPHDDVVGTLAAAYARCARTRLPVYDWLRVGGSEGPPVRFDRLILPMSEDGTAISHLVGIVHFADFPTATETP